MHIYSHTEAAADIIKLYKPNFTPKIGVILGSGLGAFADKIQDSTIIPYEKLPGFPHCEVAGHAGNLHLGYIKNIPVVCFQGRIHVYEGSVEPIPATIRTIKLLGAETVIITNASGSLRKDVHPGDLMLITDHINFQFTNALIGPNKSEFGDRHVSMGNAYNINLRKKFLKAAKSLKIKLAQGVYLAVSGPNFETAAEIKFFQSLADVVGMSLVQETIIARHCGLKVAAITAITNYGEGLSTLELSHEQTLAGAKLAAEKMLVLLATFIANYE